MFEEVQLELNRRKDQVLTKLNTELKVFEADVLDLLLSLSTRRKLQTCEDNASYIKVCNNGEREREKLRNEF